MSANAVGWRLSEVCVAMSSSTGSRAVVRPAFSLLWLVALISACGGGDSTPGGSRGGQGTIAGAPGQQGNGNSQGTAGAAGAGGDGFGNSMMMTMAPRTMPPAAVNPNACQSTSMKAETGLAAVDIVWIIDGSGSMIDEAARLQQNMASFTSTIAMAGVDTHVVLIGPDDLAMGSTLAGSGQYRFVKDDVDSFNALDRLIARFADYSTFLRPAAHVHFIIVTDDESRYMNLGAPMERAEGFRTAMDGLLAVPFTVHAIASPGMANELPCTPVVEDPAFQKCCLDSFFGFLTPLPPGCDMYGMKINLFECPALGGAAANGVTYQQLVTATTGVFANICAADWSKVFSSLSDAVIESAPLPCNYPIPPAPAGMSLDRNKVNVKYTPQGADPAMVQPYGKVGGVDGCGDLSAWYFDNEMTPTQVMLCPTACNAVGSGTGGSVDVLFGCETVVVK